MDERAAKAKLPPVDGLNMVPYLLGKTEESPRKEVCRSQLCPSSGCGSIPA